MPSVIALDAMGSDRAPKPEIDGAIQAARNYDVRVLLVGPQHVLRPELERHPAAALLPIEVVHASEVITMEDKAVAAVRAKRDSSMRVAARLVRDGRAARICDCWQYGRGNDHGEDGAGSHSGRGSSGIGGSVSDRDRNGSFATRCGRERGQQTAQPRTICGNGRDLFSQYVWDEASPGRVAFHWRRRDQGQRADAGSRSNC